MLPRGALSVDEFPFTSKEIASLASGGNRERGIAAALGFAEPSAFIRAFKALVGNDAEAMARGSPRRPNLTAELALRVA